MNRHYVTAHICYLSHIGIALLFALELTNTKLGHKRTLMKSAVTKMFYPNFNDSVAFKHNIWKRNEINKTKYM